MKLKTFSAASMSQALAQVKRELGAGAVILHTRSYKRGGVFGIGAKVVVEITAADARDVGHVPHRTAKNRMPEQRPAPARAAAPGVASLPAQQPVPTAGSLIQRTYQVAKAEFAQQSLRQPSAGTTLLDPPASTINHDQLAEEMRTVKRMVGRMMHQQRERSSSRDVPDTLFDQYLMLLEQEVAEELAEQVVQQVRDALDPASMNDQTKIHKAMVGAIAQLIPTEEVTSKVERGVDGRPRTIALIGPTGVGKTTTIAKLAANFKLKQKKNVGLITLDTYRIAAVDQLRTYANIIGVPLHVVAQPEQLLEALRQCANCDVVLMDTAGRSQKDDPKLEQLASYIRIANPHEVHLVLSSTCTQSVMLDSVQRFSKVRTDRIIFTKLDEAVSFGVLLNVARKVNKHLSYITTGQEVPHHIEPSSPRRLASLVLGEGI